MRKTRIHDLAAEFGIDSGQLIKLLADMDIHVRSHMSGLDPDQVALVRARWEREKRRASGPQKKTTRRRARGTGVEATAQPEVATKHPRRRRRSAAEVAAKAAESAELEPQVEVPSKITFTEPEPAVEPQEEPPSPQEAEDLRPAATAEAVAAAPEPVEPVAAAEVAAPEPDGAEAEPPVIPRRVPRAPKTPQRSGSGRRSRPAAPAPPRPVASAAPGEVAEERKRDRKRRRRGKRTQVDREAVQANISRTLASIKGPGTRRPSRRRDETSGARELEASRRAEEKEREKTTIRVNEFITVAELAGMLHVPPTDIVAFCFKELSMMVTVNQRLDFDQIDLIAGEFGFNAVREEGYASAAEVTGQEADDEADLVRRPPVVTVMGHVDHGKTSLLDYIRHSNVTKGEAGGITQHIGAYRIEVADGKVITFLDTPGHEAFTAMRARGAQITDLVVLVVAADDKVMPQTVEAISHAKNAGVPIVVAINKIDLPAADPEKVKQDLLKHEVLLEEFGGDTMWASISAKTGQGVDDLLEKILLQAELLDNKANPNRLAAGAVIESTLDPGKGPVATILVESGTLRVGDHFICGNQASRVRAMIDESGARVEEAGPSIPVQVLGFSGVPQAGDTLTVVSEAEQARDIAQRRQRLDREADHRRTSRAVTLEQLSKRIEEGKVQHLNIIIKADQGGPAEALADAFAQLSTDEVQVAVIHRGVGGINESDVVFAKASDAVIIGFHVRPDANARAAAERETVDIRTYRVIYEAVEDVKQALEGMLAPEEREEVLGEAEVREVFKISGVGTIAGCYVRQGVVRRGARVRVVRDGVEIFGGVLNSLKRFKDDAREVREGLECGMGIENFNDVKVGDILEPFQIVQVARTLETAGAEKAK
ncbi:MAG: translation initiation factor IF-2 [Gemmatimonadales bacterium]